VTFFLRWKKDGQFLAARPVFGQPVLWTSDLGKAHAYSTRADAEEDARFAWPSEWWRLCEIFGPSYVELDWGTDMRPGEEVVFTMSPRNFFQPTKLVISPSRAIDSLLVTRLSVGIYYEAPFDRLDAHPIRASALCRRTLDMRTAAPNQQIRVDLRNDSEKTLLQIKPRFEGIALLTEEIPT
jgi:hypothetical protein